MKTGDTAPTSGTAPKPPSTPRPPKDPSNAGRRRLGQRSAAQALPGTEGAKAGGEGEKTDTEPKPAEPPARPEGEGTPDAPKEVVPGEGAPGGGAPGAGEANPGDGVRDPVSRAAVEGFDLDALGDGEDGLSFTDSDDVGMENVKPKILIAGDSGAGKTHFASSADGVCVCLVEPQGFATIKATGRSVLVPGRKGKDGTPRITTADELRAFMRMATSGRLKAAGVRIIVFDSGTEIQQLFIDEILRSKKVPAPAQGGKGPGQPPAKGPPAKGQAPAGKAGAKPDGKAKGPAPEMTQADWGVLASKMRLFLRMVRDLDYIIVMLALTIVIEDEEGGVKIRRVYPNFQGATRQSISAYFNIVGYLYKVALDQAGKVKRYVLVDADERFHTKSFGPVAGIVEADLEAWLTAIADGTELGQAAGAKLPGAARRRLGGRSAAQATPPEADAETDDEEVEEEF